MRVLVTGGSGRLGGYVLRELLSVGHSVQSFGRNAPMVEGAGFAEGEISSLESLTVACRGHDAIVHMAAVPHPKRATPEALRQANIIGMYNILDAAVASGVEKVVFASSGTVLGFTFQVNPMVPSYFPVDEDHPCEPQDEYGLSKLVDEIVCKRYTDAFGLRTICLRINANWPLDRYGAQIAARSGANKANPQSVEDVWESYAYQLERPDGPFANPGPPPPHHNLWMYTDARDCGQAFRLAVENRNILHDVFLFCADDTWSVTPTSELLSKYYPGVPLKSPLEEYASAVSHERATRLLGYRPQYRWRETEFGEWFKERSR